MNFSKLLMYKLIERNQCLIICHQNDNVQNPDAVPLIIADGETIVEYLHQYIGLRNMGRSMREAHREALKGAVIISNGVLDGPEPKI